MGTQGLLTILGQDNRVLFKIICGCNAQTIFELVDEIYKIDCLNTNLLYMRALELHFGCEKCLVVMDNKIIIFQDDIEICDNTINFD